MDADRVERLIGGYLAGTLQDTECAELAELVRTSAEAREALVSHFMADRLLGEAPRPPMDSDRVIQAITSAGSPQFADRVLSRVEALRPATRRRLQARRTNPGALAWRLGLVAAGLFVTVPVILSLTGPPPSPLGPPSVKEGPRRPVEKAADQAREERDQIETDLAYAEDRKRQLAEELKRVEDEQKRAELKAKESDLERIAAEFRAKLEAAKKKESVAREAAAPVTPPRENPPSPLLTRAAAVAKVESARGSPGVTAGDEILADQAVVVGPGGLVVLRYPDQTRLELGADTETREFRGEGGKRAYVAKGTVSAEVSRQPAGQPFVLATPHGDATVLGTTLRILVDPDPKKGTRLEVTEGKVQLKGLRGKPVDVSSGHYAVAAVGVEPVARILAGGLAQSVLNDRGAVTIKFGAPGAKLPDEVLLDSGGEFDATRGFGWATPNGEAPGVFWQGQPVWRRNAVPSNPGPKNPMTASQLSVGWSTHKETWRMPVANGHYLVTLTVGDPGAYAQGPHHVWVEGRQIVNAMVTQASRIAEFKDVPVEVVDGELTMTVGGSGKDLDGTSDTKLCSLTVRRSRR